jgi:hypothetical protein
LLVFEQRRRQAAQFGVVLDNQNGSRWRATSFGAGFTVFGSNHGKSGGLKATTDIECGNSGANESEFPSIGHWPGRRVLGPLFLGNCLPRAGRPICQRGAFAPRPFLALRSGTGEDPMALLRKVRMDEDDPWHLRVGLWTMLELIDMVRFCQAVLRAHPELAEPYAHAEPERRRRV